ncbi:DASH complex subunit Dad3-domain-containing protein [Peziza echinospora]|nr:DASH complex subunit Dad3-domain-containing protein [Peziza echinospora]
MSQQLQSSTAGLGATSSTSAASASYLLTPLEQEVLDEYALLLNNMNILANSISALSNSPTAQILDSLRELEKKMGLVFTSLKASVYSIVLQQQLDEEQDGGGRGEGESGEEGSDGSY